VTMQEQGVSRIVSVKFEREQNRLAQTTAAETADDTPAPASVNSTETPEEAEVVLVK